MKVPLSSVSHSSKLIKPKEGVVGNFNFWPVGQPRWQPDLRLASEGGVAAGGCYRLVGLSPNLWDLMLSPIRVRVELNWRTPSCCQGIACWCGKTIPPPLRNPDTCARVHTHTHTHIGIGCRIVGAIEIEQFLFLKRIVNVSLSQQLEAARGWIIHNNGKVLDIQVRVMRLGGEPLSQNP